MKTYDQGSGRVGLTLEDVMEKVERAYLAVLDFLFKRASGGVGLWGQRAWAIGLLIAGGLLWAYLLNWGEINFLYHDWAEGIGHRVAFLQDAVRTGRLPLHMPDPSALRNVTDRYLSIPDTILSPQVFMLGILDLGEFVVFNTVLVFSLGLLGMWRLANRYDLSPIPLTAMFFVLSFHGRITDLIIIGDIHWAGYFLLPWFAYYLLQAIEEEVGWMWTLKMSVVLLFVFLQGSFHLYLISLTFMAILGLSNRRLFLPMLRGGIFALLAGMLRITSPALDAGNIDTEFLSGFDSAWQLVSSTVELRPMLRSEVFRHSPLNPLGWWEIDHFIGLIGLLFLLVFGVGIWFRRQNGKPGYRELIIPTIALVVFSIGRVFRLISILNIPMLSSQRVSTRFFILVLVMLSVLAAIHLQRLLDKGVISTKARVGLLGGLVVLVNDIWQHAKLWRVRRLPELFDARDVDLSLAYVANHPDPEYVAAVTIGTAITLASLGFLVWMAYRESREQGSESVRGTTNL